MGLDYQTEQRMRELFGGRHCCQCGQPAARLMEDRYYCHGHFLAARRGQKRAPGKRASRKGAALRLLAGEVATQACRTEAAAPEGAPSSLPQ